MIVDTASPYGNPWCPVCHYPVNREGQFCSAGCWQHFHWATFDSAEIVEMKYLDIEDQSWYHRDHERDT